MNALLKLRQIVSPIIIGLLWIDSGLILLRNLMRADGFDMVSIIATLLTAAVATGIWCFDRVGPTTRMVTSMAHAVAVAILVFTFAGSPLQIDLHMYFFATLAICAAWIDWRAIVGFTLVVATQHLLLAAVFPFAIFPDHSGLVRVGLHALILVLESGVLVGLALSLTSALVQAETASEQANHAMLQAEELSKRQAISAESELERVRLESEREAAANGLREHATSRLADSLRRLAAGELAFELSEPLGPEYEGIRHDLNTTIRTLGKTLSSVSEATRNIDGGINGIGASADDLSKRTERQAASLEETAAALDQITGNIANSTKRTDEARSVARQANESAEQSGIVVANAIRAMEKIEQSSSEISNIIGVIDEIAFQTNLLALNAGVEAARAGDAGRGFAVVAQEVRELAQRSAQAAKEIKALIRNASDEVKNGVQLVSQTGAALTTIEHQVVRINEHMEAIAISAKEQSVGIAQVNAAVNQMDQVTNQNAAMVQETNAASASLAAESGHLRELISQFQLGPQDADSGRDRQVDWTRPRTILVA